MHLDEGADSHRITAVMHDCNLTASAGKLGAFADGNEKNVFPK